MEASTVTVSVTDANREALHMSDRLRIGISLAVDHATKLAGADIPDWMKAEAKALADALAPLVPVATAVDDGLKREATGTALAAADTRYTIWRAVYKRTKGYRQERAYTGEWIVARENVPAVHLYREKRDVQRHHGRNGTEVRLATEPAPDHTPTGYW